MSKARDRRAAKRLTERRQSWTISRTLIDAEPDPERRARMDAAYCRKYLGFVPITDDQPHYICELGLTKRNLLD